MNHRQGVEQRRQFGIAIEMGTGQHIHRQPCATQLAAHALLDLLQLFQQAGPQLGVGGQFFALYQAAEYRQRRLQRMTEVAQCMP